MRAMCRCSQGVRVVCLGMSRVWATALAALLLASACRDDDVARLEAIRDEICACKSILCANTALKKLPPRTQRDLEASYREQHVAKLMLECLARLHAAGRPTTDPDAEAK